MNRLRRYLAVFLIAGLLVGILPAAAAAQEGIGVRLDGQVLDFDVPPQLIAGRTMVPLRAIFEALGAQVQWYPETQGIEALRGQRRVWLQVGQSAAEVDGRPVTLDVPAQVIDGRTLVPLRFVGEALGAQVVWDGATSTVHIASPEPAPPPVAPAPPPSVPSPAPPSPAAPAEPPAAATPAAVAATAAAGDGEVVVQWPAATAAGTSYRVVRWSGQAERPADATVLAAAVTDTVYLDRTPPRGAPLRYAVDTVGGDGHVQAGPATAPVTVPLMAGFIRLGPIRGQVLVVRGSGRTAMAAAWPDVAPGAGTAGAAVVVWSHPEDSEAVPAEPGMALLPGDSILTADGAFATIEMDRGQTLSLSGGTRIEVQRHDIEPDTGRQASRFKLLLGRLWANLRDSLRPESRFEVETPTIVVGVRGSQFGAEEQRAYAASGNVYVAQPGAEEDPEQRQPLPPGRSAFSDARDRAPATQPYTAADLPEFMQKELYKEREALPPETRHIAEAIPADIKAEAEREAEEERKQREAMERQRKEQALQNRPAAETGQWAPAVTLDPEQVAAPAVVTVTISAQQTLDTAAGPTVTFGSAEPYNQYRVTGQFVSDRLWQGSIRVDTDLPPGTYTVRAAGFRSAGGQALAAHVGPNFRVTAADDRFLVYVRDGNLFRYDLGTGKERQLTRGAFALSPRVTPDDRSVVYVDLLQGGNLYAIPADGAGEPALYLEKQPQWARIAQFDLSPDGNEVVFRADPADADAGGSLYYTRRGEVLPIDAGTTRYKSSALAEAPQWVTDQAIAFRHTDAEGMGRIAAFCFTPGTHTPLTPADGRNYDTFAVAPDGQTLVASYQATANSGGAGWLHSRLVSTKPGGTGAAPQHLPLRAAEFPPYFWDADPAFSRDGRYLAYRSELGTEMPATILVKDLHGAAEPVAVARGIQPAWGGGKAYTGTVVSPCR